MSTFLNWEAEAFGDIQMVDMEENMNDGKSYEYFASLGNMYPADVDATERPWDYAMKLDDDAFLNIPNLLERLRPMVPRRNTWFVRSLAPTLSLLNVNDSSQGSGDVEELYMYGPGYVLSWDLVTWLSDHREELQGFMYGWEDKMISEMLKWGGKAADSWVSAVNEYTSYPAMPTNHGPWSRELGPDIILVHGLKSVGLLGEVIQYFLGNETLISEETVGNI
jgi:hypothetical protein